MVERAEGSEWCEECRIETPPLYSECLVGWKMSHPLPMGGCTRFGHYDKAVYQCVTCFRSQPGHSKQECLELSDRREGERRAEAELKRLATKEGQAEENVRRMRLDEIRGGLSDKTMAGLRVEAEGRLGDFMRRKLERERRAGGELGATTRGAIEHEVGLMIEERYGGISPPRHEDHEEEHKEE